MDFLGIGGWEIFMVILIAVLLWGPGRIVEIARTLGKIVRKARNITSDLTAQINKEVDEQKRAVPPVSPEESKGKDTFMKTGQPKNLSILGHIAELRSRLVKCAIAVVITSIVAFVFSDPIFHILTLPANNAGFTLIYIDMTEMFSIYMTVCLTAGIAVAMPYLVYQILMFVFPALNFTEKKYVLIMIPWIAIMFIGGVVFSYIVMLPPAIQFLLTFGSNIAVPQIRIGSYITVITRVMLAAGVIFELPVISTFLARLGLITSSWLAGKRKFAVVLAFILGAVITPTADPVNQILLAVPLVALYEMSIWLAKLVQPKKTVSETVLTSPQGSDVS